MDGLVDEISVYNRALSVGEIQAIYQAGPEGKRKNFLNNAPIAVNDSYKTAQGEPLAVTNTGLLGGLAATEFAEGSYAIGVAAVLQPGGFIAAGEHNGNLLLAKYAASEGPFFGDRDLLFGSDGLVVDDLHPGANGGDSANDILAHNGKIIVVGSSEPGGLNSADFMIARYDASGSRDMSFGGGDGFETTDFGSTWDSVYGAAVDADGKIVVVGPTRSPSGGDFGIVRYDANGILDTTFGSNGKVVLDIVGGDDEAWAVGVQSDGKIVVAGNAWGTGGVLARLNSDGSLDDGTAKDLNPYDGNFGTAGKVMIDVAGIEGVFVSDLVVQSDGKIVVAGSAVSPSGITRMFLARFDEDGSFDEGFGSGGAALASLDEGDSVAYGVTRDETGKYVLAGSYGVPGSDGLVARYNTDGTPDTSFGDDGYAAVDFPSSSWGYFDDVAIEQSTGKITVVGCTTNQMAVARFNPDGTLVSFPTGVLHNDSDADGNKLTAALVPGSGPTHGSLRFDGDGTFEYEPLPDYVGLDSFSYTAFDGISETPATVTIEVREATVAYDDDALPPAIVLGGSSGTETDTRPHSFNWNVSDASGLSYVEVSITRDAGSGPEEIYQAAERPAGLVAWWPGEDGQDLVSGNDGSLMGGTSLVPGRVGSALSFHGFDDFDGASDVFRASAVAFPAGNQDRTMELWVKVDSVPSSGDRGIATYGNFGSWGQTYGVFVDPLRNNAIAFSQWGSAIWGPELTLGQWHHAAVTNVGNSVILYLDGEQVAAGTLEINTAAGTQFYIGGNPYHPDSQLDGQVDEISVYNRALTAEEIRGIYRAGAAGKGVATTTGSFNFDAHGLGTYAVTVSATDRDNDRPGDVLSATETRNVVIVDDDDSAPQIQFANVDADLDSEQQMFSWQVTDASGLSSLCITVIQEDEQGTREIFRTTDLSRAISNMHFDEYGLGTFTVTVSATDNDADRAGDQLTATTTKTVVVVDDDTSPPIINILPDTRSYRQIEAQEQVFSWEIVGEYQSQLQSAHVVITRDTGAGPEQIFLSNDVTYPVRQSFNFDGFGPGTYEITIITTDGDNDRPNDQLTSSASRVVVVLPGRGVVWSNRNDQSDCFSEVFGSQAETARQVVDAAIARWNAVISDFGVEGGPDAFPIILSIDGSNTLGGRAMISDARIDAAGIPRCGQITLDRGRDGHGDGWYVDPNPADSAEFSNVANAFEAYAEPGSPVYDLYLHDLFSTVVHEIGHSVGVSHHYLTWRREHTSFSYADTGQTDGSVHVFAFTGPTIQALLYDTSHVPYVSTPWYTDQASGLVYRGASSVMRPGTPVQGRVEVTNFDAALLRDAYGYTIAMPETFGTFYANLNRSTGALAIAGGRDACSSKYWYGEGASDDSVLLSRSGDELVVSIDIENDNRYFLRPAGVDETAPFVSRFPLSEIQSITIEPGEGGDDTVTLEAWAGAVTMDGRYGADKYVVNLGGGGGPVAINDTGTDGTDRLFAYGTEAADVISKVPGHITFGSPVVQTIDFSSIENITLDGRGGDDDITDAGATWVLGGEGNDEIHIAGSDPSGVTVDGQGGSDSIQVSLGNLQGNVEIVDTGTTGGDDVVVAGTAGQDHITISGNQLTSGSEVIQFASINTLSVDGAAGDDTITVLPLAEPLAGLELLAGEGTDAITVDNVGASVGTMLVDGGAGGQDSFVAVGDLPAETQVENLALVVSDVSTTPISEGETTVLVARITDPDLAAAHLVAVNWGDGSAIDEVSYPAGSTSISLSHRYLDDNASDSYPILMTVTASGGSIATVHTSVAVNNVAALVNPGEDTLIGEGTAFNGSGAFTDPGADTWMATVDYGDGSPVQPLVLGADRTFNLSHVYTDDGVYTVIVKVMDDDGGVGSDTRSVTVTNAPPALAFNQPPYTVWENETTTTMVEVNDPGADTRTVQIGWGDGGSDTYVLPGNWRVFSEGDFAAGDWQERVVKYGNEGNVTVSQAVYPGTSDTYRRVDITLNDSSPSWISQVGVYSILPSSLYNPQTEGEIVTVDFELANFRLLDTTAREFCFKLALRQGGEYFVSPNYPVARFGQPRTEKLTFTQNSFSREGDPNTHPNFSASGGPIEFGFLVHALVGYGEPGVAVSAGFDNFVAAVNRSVIARHLYLDDPLGSGDGQYTVSFAASDGDGGTATAAKQVLVKNVAPVVTLDTLAAIDENGIAALAGSIADQGTLDTFTLTIDWGDLQTPNNIQSFALGAAAKTKATDGIAWDPLARRFAVDRQYAGRDDAAVPQWQHTIGVTAVDDDGGVGAQNTQVTVRNLVDLSGRVFNDLDNDGAFDEGQDQPLAKVLVKVWDEALANWVAGLEAESNSEGRYLLNGNLAAGAYRLVEVYDDDPDSPTFQGLLDGRETPGSLGGTMIDTADSNTICGIVVGEPGTTPDAVDYLFAEVEPSDLFGRVWRDLNNDGQVNFNEADIDGVLIRLVGTDDRGQVVDLTTTTAGGTGFAFTNLRPGAYAIEETQPAGFDDGVESLGAVTNPNQVNQAAIAAGYVDGNDRFSGVKLAPGSIADFYNFGERPQAGAPIDAAATASIGFWHNKNGQALIQQLSDFAAANGGSATQLGDWLAATFPSMYGSGAYYDAASGEGRDMNFLGKSDEYIAATFQYLHQRDKKTMIENGGVPKIDAQVLAVALAAYATSENLAGTAARPYGFSTSADGISYSTFNVLGVLTLDEASQLGLSAANGNLDADGNATILNILLATNAKATLGLLYDYDSDLSDGHNDEGDGTIDAFERLLRILANDLYGAINE